MTWAVSFRSRYIHRAELLCQKKNSQRQRAGQAVQVPSAGAGVPVETDVAPRVALILGTQMLPTGAGVSRGQGRAPAAGSPGWSRCAPQSGVPSGSPEIATRWKGLGGGPARGFRILLDLTGTTQGLLTHTPLFSSCPPCLLPATGKPPRSPSGTPWSRTSEFRKTNTFWNSFSPTSRSPHL